MRNRLKTPEIELVVGDRVAYSEAWLCQDSRRGAREKASSKRGVIQATLLNRRTGISLMNVLWDGNKWPSQIHPKFLVRA